jgi:hypothetical protein
VITTSVATSTADNTVATPRSSRARLGRGDGVRFDDQAGQQPGPAGDRRNDKAAVAAQLQRRSRRPDSAGRDPRSLLVTARREPCRLSGRVDAADLHRDRGEATGAQNQHHDQRSDGQGRLDGGKAAVTGQTFVLSARLMMLVNAPTIESPVTTLYRIAPNAAAAIVPMAYSTVDIPASSYATISIRVRIR